MKNLKFFNKVVFFFNSVVAVLLLCSYVLPYMPPHIFPSLSVLSLVLPILIIVNALFFIYWLIGRKRQLLLSGITLVIGITHIFSLIRLGSPSKDTPEHSLKIMTYNVRQFNINGWSEEEGVGNRILEFVREEDPDVISFQEYHPKYFFNKKDYPYEYRVMNRSSRNFGQIIFSKYPIIDSGSLDFERTGNNGIYADIATSIDTIRVYNMHFQSLRISPSLNNLQKQNSKRLLGRLGQSFVKQEQQVQKFLKNEASSPYPVIVTGDFNNSATSYMYRKVLGDKVDAFAKAGSGTGATYYFDMIPLRIDFILADEKFPVVDFETFNLPLSDHRPSMATLALKQ